MSETRLTTLHAALLDHYQALLNRLLLDDACLEATERQLCTRGLAMLRQGLNLLAERIHQARDTAENTLEEGEEK
jgi:hypothetical protein